MQFWRFSRKRSVRRLARRELMAARGRSFGVLLSAGQARLRIAGLWVPLVVSTMLSLPLALYLGRDPGWLSAAWPVDAVLVGFVIPLVVFLLQAVSDGGLRGARTFRVAIIRSALVWPTMFSLWFVVWAAAIERWGTTHAAASWVATWAVGLFVAQWVLLLITFVRLMRLLAPTEMTQALGQSLADDIEQGVLERLIRENAAGLLQSALNQAGWQLTGLGGWEVTVKARGFIDDFDIQLPQRLEALGQIQQLRLLGVSLGDRVRSGFCVATLASEPHDDAVLQLYRKAVVVRRKPRVSDGWEEVFRDVVDLALRAVEGGNEGESELAFNIIVQAVMAVPAAFERYGQDYSDGRIIPWQRTNEDQMFAALLRLSVSAATSPRTDALVHVVALPYQLAVASAEAQVGSLFWRSLHLWLQQAQEARGLGVRQRTNDVNQRIHRLSSSLGHDAVRRLLSPQRRLEDRLQAAQSAKEVVWFRAALLKRHVDAQDIPAFQALLDEGIPLREDPRRDQHTLKQQLEQATTESERQAATTSLEQATRVADAFDEVRESSAWGRFRVGAWATWEYEHDRISQATWDAVCARLSRPFSDSDISRRLAAMAHGELVKELDDWDRDRVEIRPSVDSWSPVDGLIALRWGTLLLLRDWGSLPSSGFEPESVHSFSGEVKESLARIESDPGRWGAFVGGEMAAKAAAIRKELEAAEDAAYELAKARAKTQ